MKNLIIFFSIFIVFSCQEEKKDIKLENGLYRGELLVKDNQVLPFLFRVNSPTTLTIFNAEEEIELNEISYKNDSVFIKFPVYEGYLAAKLVANKLKGSFIKESLNRVVPFSAEKNENRFAITNKPTQNVSGNWEVTFSPDTNNSYAAKGIFKQEGSKVSGTFRTTTGDYRYLEGVMNSNQMQLSVMDGAHAFLFSAKVTDSTLNGTFYSGNHFKEPFVAKRNNNYELPNANELTFLKEGYDKIDFSFPDENGKQVSLSDKRFKDKVVLVQIMGTWCPNCLDESIFYANYYNNKKSSDLEIVALAFEYAKTEDRAKNNIKRLKERTGINYPVLLAQVGTSSKQKANKKLPMLNHVLSYPTTIYIDKKGNVRKIHTGFNGPATGNEYTKFVKEFKGFMNELLSE